MLKSDIKFLTKPPRTNSNLINGARNHDRNFLSRFHVRFRVIHDGTGSNAQNGVRSRDQNQMKRSFRDDDRHASISRAKLGAIFQGSLSLRGRTFLTITCATGMAIDQPCKSNNNVPSNVLSVVTFFYFLFSARISLNRRSSLLQLLKKNTSTISSLLDTISLYLREIS